MKISEETLEQEVATYLARQLSGNIITQPLSTGRTQADIILAVGDHRIVIELEIGGSSKIVEALIQAENYKDSFGADGLLAIVYPESARRTVAEQTEVVQIVENVPVQALIITPFLKDRLDGITIGRVVDRILDALTTPIKTPDLQLMTSALREAIASFSAKLRANGKLVEAATNTVVQNFDLFATLASSDDEVKIAELRDAAYDLTAYVLINQILLYRLLARPLNLPPLLTIRQLSQLHEHFARVTEIDYRAVYNVDVVQKLPAALFPEVQVIVRALNALEPEYLPHDLLGRMFHEFLPFETRKRLATFYTKPVAAELLAALAIPNAAAQVIDPACGSGTLLVSSYHQKRSYGPSRSHKVMVEKEIFGVDLMPFAAHLAALNLTLQDLDTPTDRVNIGIGNALSLTHRGSLPKQLLLLEEETRGTAADADAAGDLEFKLPETVDVVIMNPPYTDLRRLDSKMLGTRAGDFPKPQNYWAYFLSLAHNLLGDKGGTIAAVLPRLIVAGDTSKEVRKWLFIDKGYELRYIVRTTREIAFSEAAAFRDYLIVLDNRKGPEKPCCVVYLKASLSELTLEKAREIGHRIRKSKPGEVVEDDDVFVSWVSQKEIRANHANLWFLVGIENPGSASTLSRFREAVTSTQPESLERLERFTIKRGFEPKPKGLYNAAFVVRPITPERTSHSSVILMKETDDRLFAQVTETGKEVIIPRRAVAHAIKTASYVGQLNVAGVHDYVIHSAFAGDMAKIHTPLGIQVKYEYVFSSIDKRAAHLLVVKRLDLGAPGTTAVAFYSDIPASSTNVLYSVRVPPEQARALCLWINSTFSILQIWLERMETRGTYCDLLLVSLRNMLAPSDAIMRQHQAEIDDLFAKYGTTKLPPLKDQFVPVHEARLENDRMWLRILGLKEQQIAEMLPRVYQAMRDELYLAVESMSSQAGTKGSNEDGHQTIFDIVE